MSYKIFVHKDCSYYPCHNAEPFRSCLFCWCPLYLFDCSGDFTIRNGIKDCSDCMIPHTEDGYDYVVKKVREHIYT